MMRTINEQETRTDAAANRKIEKLFYRLAAAQIAQILLGAGLSFFIAPASLFVSRTEGEAFAWIAAAFAGIALIALGLVLIALSIVAAAAYRREKSWHRIVGIATAGIALLALPFGTVAGGALLRRIRRTR